MHNLKPQYSKYKFCQYLYVSSQTLLHAVSLFSSTKEGDLERSFSAFHKAWVLLFQSDILSEGGNGYLHECYCPAPVFNCNDEKCINKKTKKPKAVFGIEGALNEIRKTDKYVTVLENGYKFSEGHGIFKEINSKENSYINLSIMRSLRNIDQHDYLESKENSYVSIMDITRPYILANINNYMETYREIFDLSESRCDIQVSKVHCSCKKLLKPQDLSDRIFFPWSYNSVFLPGKMLWKDEGGYFTNLDLLQKTLTALDLKITNSTKKMPEKVERLKESIDKEHHPKKILNLKDEIRIGKLELKAQTEEKFRLEEKIKLIEAIIDNFYEKNEFADTSIRKEFFNAITSLKEKKEDIFRLKIDIVPSSWLLTSTSYEDLQENQSSDILETIKINSIKEYLFNFKYSSMKDLREALESDDEISGKYSISSSKLLSFEDEVSHISGERYFGEYFGIKRYTEDFYEYSRNRILGKI